MSKDQKNYSGSLALSKLQHVRMKMKGKKGKVDCLVIPIEANYLVEGKEGAVYMPIRLITKEEQDEYGQNGFISQSVDTKVWKEAKPKQQEKMKKLPILGNVKNWDSSGGDSNASSGNKGAVEENDDLPF